MNGELLKKANSLDKDIRNIEKVLKDAKNHRWISAIGAWNTDLRYSIKFQTEFVEWLKQKKEQYEKELENL